MPLTAECRSVVILSVCQALFKISTITVVMLGGLVGAALSGSLSLATLPIAASIMGTAGATLPASFLMKWFGRRNGFVLGALLGAGGGGLSVYAIELESFWLFCAGNAVIGMYHAFAQYYRFAAVDVVSSGFRHQAISLVLGGGLVAALVGPGLAVSGMSLFGSESYIGAYLALIVLNLLTLSLLYGIRFPVPTLITQGSLTRPIKAIARQSNFLVAVICGITAYSVMNATMVALPLVMTSQGNAADDTALVMRWHMVAMFAPSFVTGALMSRFGVPRVMLAGTALMAGGASFVISGTVLTDFVLALALMGIGWNFLYVGATGLLTESHTPEEKAKVQGCNELLVFASTALSAMAVGPLLQYLDWETLGYLMLVALLMAFLALTWFIKK
ncbi:MFS transporter [Marinobacter gelidimuriae]|uniref:MFS transporter n=1 Tax=Marinobacter gelidimuriae TaxID=2739064 RepID=UPI000363C595|nr:MFS transporter [Marinobacter gelidimuriae]